MPGRAELREELQRLKEERDGVSRKIGEMRRHHNALSASIEDIERALVRIGQEPNVSDHAVMRYLQRKLGVDVDAIRAEILDDSAKAAIKLGAKKIIRDGYQFLVSREGCITTVLSPGMNSPVRSSDAG